LKGGEKVRPVSQGLEVGVVGSVGSRKSCIEGAVEELDGAGSDACLLGGLYQQGKCARGIVEAVRSRNLAESFRVVDGREVTEPGAEQGAKLERVE
jgi:hypothetical protein